MSDFTKIKYWIVDVDGTMTDAGIYYDEHGNEIKKFCTKDAAGYFAARQVGMTIVVITGRECEATRRRLIELGVEEIYQNIKDKKEFLQQYMYDKRISKEEMAYIGDDLNDLPSMKLVGYVACPEDACSEIKDIADYVSPVCGGHGAVRDCIENVLRKRGLWTQAVQIVYGID